MTSVKKHGLREWYGDLKLQSKFTLALTLIVVIPPYWWLYSFTINSMIW